MFIYIYIYILILEPGCESNNTSSGGRRRLPTLPPNRSPRNSIGGEGSSTATLLPSGQHRNLVQHNTLIKQFASEPTWDSHNISQQDKSFDTLDHKLQQQIHGWIQFSLLLEQCNLYITVWSAQSLQMIEDETNLSLPHPYAIVRLYSLR